MINECKIITVGDLLTNTNLAIPNYQRPYKWTSKHVNQLLEDVYTHKNKKAYRLGTLVAHQEEKKLNIVDGQQRTITLILIAKAILQHKSKECSEQNDKLKTFFNSLQIVNFEFSNPISINNILTNYREIERLVVNMDVETIEFLFFKCELIQFTLNNISEAFQFFDSQNARGKDLEPHDLLKAFHLREFTIHDEPVKKQVVETWESMDTGTLSKLFGDYLFRIKGWLKSNSSRYFTKDNIGLFKGVNIHKTDNYPYTDIMRIVHFFVDNYNNNYERQIDLKQMSFPFQIDQIVINGKRFFEMVNYYKKIVDKIQSSETANLTKNTKRIIKTINEYDARFRTGDQYVRMLFDCALIYYMDRFGNKDISKAIEKIFIWAYSVRLKYQAVRLASIDNYVIEELNIFKIIREASTPNDFINVSLNAVKGSEVKANKVDAIENLFKKMKYYE